MGHNPPSMSDGSVTSQSSLKEQVAELEKKIIFNTLKAAKTIRQCGRILKISHPALIKKMKKYNIKKMTRIA
jgi:transcriptional regulator of aroF, aroG, tyrA and aromatic amino acid transport